MRRLATLAFFGTTPLASFHGSLAPPIPGGVRTRARNITERPVFQLMVCERPPRRFAPALWYVAICAAVFLLFPFSNSSFAHDGPPYPVIVDKNVGPSVLSVWADPDVGIGTFFITLEPVPGGALPGDIKIDITVQPVSGRLPEARYAALRDTSNKRTQFKAEVPFDSQERWRVRVTLESSQGSGEATTEVDVTPPGFGRWDLAIYFFPFLLIGFLWLRAFFRKPRHAA